MGYCSWMNFFLISSFNFACVLSQGVEKVCYLINGGLWYRIMKNIFIFSSKEFELIFAMMDLVCTDLVVYVIKGY